MEHYYKDRLFSCYIIVCFFRNLLLMAIQFRVSSESLQGLRTNNEDNINCINSDGLLLALVADGMGGQAAGEVASKEAVKRISNYVIENYCFLDGSPEGDIALIKNSFIEANQGLVQLSLTSPRYTNMGTTMVTMFYREESKRFIIASLGDSRCYVLENGKLAMITVDHSYAHALYMAGSITISQLATHPFRNRLYKYLGGKELSGGPDVFFSEIKPGQRFLLCSDGLSGSLSEVDLQNHLATEPLEGLATKLSQIAIQNGSTDNTSVIIVDVVVV